MKRLRALAKNKFVKAYLLSIPAFLILDFFMWGYFTTHPIEPLAIFLFTLIRTSFADLMISHVMDVQDSDSAMFRGRSFVLAFFIYGPPLLTIFYYISVFKPLPWYDILLIIDPRQFLFWITMLPFQSPNPISNIVCYLILLMSYVFIYDFIRLILFIKLKTILLPYGNKVSRRNSGDARRVPRMIGGEIMTALVIREWDVPKKEDRLKKYYTPLEPTYQEFIKKYKVKYGQCARAIPLNGTFLFEWAVTSNIFMLGEADKAPACVV